MMRKRLHYYSHRGHRQHPSSVVYHLGSLVLPVALVVLASFLAFGSILAPSDFTTEALRLSGALALSLARLFGAYFLSLLIGIPLGLLAESNRHVEAALLPVFDVLESLPVLAFFPVIILFFVRAGWLEGAALFILVFSMVWNIAFSTVGGLKVIPEDVKAVGKVFGFSPWRRFTHITLPALFPPLVTGSILSLAAGWNIVIVAEALHAYAPLGTRTQDLFGIGSILVSASTSGSTTALLTAMGLLVVVIALINLFVWQPLLAKAERFKFE